MSILKWTLKGVCDNWKTHTIISVKGKMKMNKKQLQFDGLLAVLHQNSDYITAKSLSEQLNLSEKTV